MHAMGETLTNHKRISPPHPNFSVVLSTNVGAYPDALRDSNKGTGLYVQNRGGGINNFHLTLIMTNFLLRVKVNLPLYSFYKRINLTIVLLSGIFYHV